MMLTPVIFNKLNQDNDAPLTLSNIIEAERTGFITESREPKNLHQSGKWKV